jgi:disulfide bond formation protein DsbB
VAGTLTDWSLKMSYRLVFPNRFVMIVWLLTLAVGVAVAGLHVGHQLTPDVPTCEWVIALDHPDRDALIEDAVAAGCTPVTP